MTNNSDSKSHEVSAGYKRISGLSNSELWASYVNPTKSELEEDEAMLIRAEIRHRVLTWRPVDEA